MKLQYSAKANIIPGMDLHSSLGLDIHYQQDINQSICRVCIYNYYKIFYLKKQYQAIGEIL